MAVWLWKQVARVKKQQTNCVTMEVQVGGGCELVCEQFINHSIPSNLVQRLVQVTLIFNLTFSKSLKLCFCISLQLIQDSQPQNAKLHSQKGIIHVNTPLLSVSYWMQNGFHPGMQHWPSQTFALHKEKINLHETERGRRWVRGLRWHEGRERETALKGEDNEEDKWQGKCGVKVREVDDRVWEVGRERENAGCREGTTRQREVLSHGQQLADWWWWEWQWGRKATCLGGKVGGDTEVQRGYKADKGSGRGKSGKNLRIH